MRNERVRACAFVRAKMWSVASFTSRGLRFRPRLRLHSVGANGANRSWGRNRAPAHLVFLWTTMAQDDDTGQQKQSGRDHGDNRPSQASPPTARLAFSHRLPPEVWQHVVLQASYLSPLKDAVQTLHSLALVCRHMNKSATPLLYRDPLLNTPQRQEAYWRTVSEHTHLWWHARSVVFGERDWPRDDRTTRPSPRLVDLGDAIALNATSSSPATLAQWAESMQLTARRRGFTPGPQMLEHVAWWEEAAVGGLLTGHAYSTRPVGEWCKPVEEERARRREQERAALVEDVDMGRGPGQGARQQAQRRDDGRDAPQGVARGGTGGAGGGQPTGLDEDDMWAAVERAAAEPAVGAAAMAAGRNGAGAAVEASLPVTADAAASASPASASASAARCAHGVGVGRAPYRYHLITGYLDPNLSKFFEAIGTLEHIELTLFQGTLLDHDLLEHQLRTILERLPILRRLEVSVGHDAQSIGSRLARITHSKVVQLAVRGVDDPRCVLKASVRTYGGGKRDSREDVRDQVVALWQRARATAGDEDWQGGGGVG